MANIQVNTGTGILQLNDTRNTLALLGKNSSPTGTKFVAVTGTGGTTYAFGYPQGNSNYGIELRDANGALLFDAVSYGKMAKPVGVMSGSIPPGVRTTQTQQQTFAAGRTYAVWLFAPVSPLAVRSGSVEVGGNINYGYYLDSQEMTVTISGATVSIKAERMESSSMQGGGQPVPYADAGKYDWRAVVLDVTNY